MKEENHKEGHVYESEENSDLVELYVPIIFPGSNQVAGVVETFKMPKQVFANISKAQTMAIGISLMWPSAATKRCTLLRSISRRNNLTFPARLET